TVVVGALDTVLAEGNRLTPDVARSLVQDAFYEAKDLSDILENLLELSRARTSRLRITPELVDLTVVAAKVTRRLAEQSTHRFALQIPADASVSYADPLRVERILYNLAHNATKYSEPESEIRIEARREGPSLVVSVHDRGVGIAPADLERIFEPFNRTPPPSPLAPAQGVGLGLTVCRRLVEAHGGRLWVESVPGRGSSFRFTLPSGPSAGPAVRGQARTR
ncbi:MAG: ATP-binding protein, partial [Candidatus Eisenbacteria bacterium]|nr:ATP-binding protein [Candidatus Eisenbacteria bacterium]